MGMNLFWWKEKNLRTVWKVEKKRPASFLVGTAHFSPYSFKKSLTRLIQGVDTVLFEGPLDQESMAKVVQYGQKAENGPSLYEALESEAIKEINKLLAARSGPQTTALPYLDLLHPANSDLLEIHTKGVRPWMTFFTTWSAFLSWKHSMDVEAYHIAQKLGKKIDYLETIEDQLAALDGIPFERIVNYLNSVKHWGGHKKVFMKAFLEGDIQKFFSMTGEFPTRCESIIAKRDPIFFSRMKLFFDRGRTMAFVGVAHIPGIQKMFLDEGYRVIQEKS
jgi:hypothetical protein